MLSKSKYTRGLQCIKSLWLYVHKKEEQIISDATQRVFSRGSNVGELAIQYFPNGEMAVLEDYPSYVSANRTKDFIAQGVETIYEATFIFNDVLVAVDILHKHDGKWNIYEVKSTKKVKQEHINDAAIQFYVVQGSGLLLNDIYIMHFNGNYIRNGNLDVQNLFTPSSIKEDVLLLQNSIPQNIDTFQAMLKENEPIIEIGKHCFSPYNCDFYEYCKALTPNDNTLAEVLSNIPVVNANEVREFISAIQYPLQYLDFETIMPGVPIFDESRPYQKIPFQYSLHIQNEKDGELQHTYFLAESNIKTDPRKGLITQLIEETKTAKTILVYNIVFERLIINELKRDFPEYADELESINKRLLDLIIPFRKKYYRTETMEGSSSIKNVLPALCPELSYDNLEIGHGMAASNAFFDLYTSQDQETITKTRENLLQYCELDTFAMVKIFEVLKKV